MESGYDYVYGEDERVGGIIKTQLTEELNDQTEENRDRSKEQQRDGKAVKNNHCGGI